MENRIFLVEIGEDSVSVTEFGEELSVCFSPGDAMILSLDELIEEYDEYIFDVPWEEI